jgi:hypothetical protein
MCPAGIRMRVDILWWPLMAAEFHGVSSHTGRIITAKKGLSCASEEARAWRTALSMSSGSYSGLAIQEPVHLYEKASRMAPNASSALKAEQ